MIKDRIKEFAKIPWKDIVDFQPDDLKEDVSNDYLKESILENGFSMPFFVWDDDGIVRNVDGHLRKSVLIELEDEGHEVPEMLSVCFLDIHDELEAKKILLEVFNQKQRGVIKSVVETWVSDVEINLGSLNMGFTTKINFNESKEVEVDGFSPVKQLVFKYNQEDYDLVLGVLESLSSEGKEKALLFLCQNENIK